MIRRRVSVLRQAVLAAAAVFVWAAGSLPASARQSAAERTPCEAEAGRRSDLYCIPLIPRPGVSAAGVVFLENPDGPFTVSVTGDGRHRHRLRVRIDALPVREPGMDSIYHVVWITDPFFGGIQRLGRVEIGSRVVGVSEQNRFAVLVSAEREPSPAERAGPIILRGMSPSMRMQGHDVVFSSPLAESRRTGGGADARPGHAHGGHVEVADPVSAPGDSAAAWPVPAMHPAITMPAALMALRPNTDPWIPDAGATDRKPVEANVGPSRPLFVSEGDTLELAAAPARVRRAGYMVEALAYNGQVPGPLIVADRGMTFTVAYRNDLSVPTTVHWHGLRLDNRFDGVPGLTQRPVAPGETYFYTVRVPDAGMFWYHPHHRGDALIDLGLYGNLFVREQAGSPAADQNVPGHVLVLDDLAETDRGMVPYGAEGANYALMGRFGRTLLVNGVLRWHAVARPGDAIRLYLTNVSNTRTFNLSVSGTTMDVVASDLGPYDTPSRVPSVIIAPAERYVVDVRMPESGTAYLVNRVQAIDHRAGTFFAETDTLGHVDIVASALPSPTVNDTARPVLPDPPAGPPDRTLLLTLKADSLPAITRQIMREDRTYFNPVEWSGTMPVMNWASTTKDVHWIIREPDTGLENEEIQWSFRQGQVTRIRIRNDRYAFHAMQHPVHMHGQRFLVVAVNGVPTARRAWKDTVLVPAGAEVDLMVEFTNPGFWMLHCHIAEHLESGMKMVFHVAPE